MIYHLPPIRLYKSSEPNPSLFETSISPLLVEQKSSNGQSSCRLRSPHQKCSPALGCVSFVWLTRSLTDLEKLEFCILSQVLLYICIIFIQVWLLLTFTFSWQAVQNRNSCSRWTGEGRRFAPRTLGYSLAERRPPCFPHPADYEFQPGTIRSLARLNNLEVNTFPLADTNHFHTI